MKRRHPALVAFVVGIVLAITAMSPAHASGEPGTVESDPATSESTAFSPAASTVDPGVLLTRSYTGSLNWSIDGQSSITGATGVLEVEKPAGSTVLAAYLMVAGFNLFDPSDLSSFRLGGVAPTFTDDVRETNSNFRNYFADVTTIVAPVVNAAAPGLTTISVDEGTNYVAIEGSALVVIFDDPAIERSSIALYFGVSVAPGAVAVADTYSLAFDPLTLAQTQDVRLSIGSAYSFGSNQNSTVTVNGQTLTEQAGHVDDCDQFVPGEEAFANWVCYDSSLITVGGVGDSLTNPTIAGPWTTTADDELYSLSPFVQVGDTTLEVESLAVNADNIFFAGIFMNGVEVVGATQIGADGDTLAATGLAPNGSALAMGMLAVVLGMGALMVARARSRRSAATI